MSTQITPKGTAYTLRETVTATGSRAALYMDDTKLTQSDIPLMIYLHGAGMTYSTWWDALQEWNKWMREFFMDQGWAILECDGGPPVPDGVTAWGGSGEQHWGGPVSRQSYAEGIEWALTQIDVGPMVSFSFSMGGLTNYWLASQSPYADRIQGMIVSCGTTDLQDRYHLKFNEIWGVEPVDVLDEAQWLQKSVGYNPLDFPESDWAGRRVLQIYGEDDTGLPWANHGALWVAKYGSVLESLQVVPQPNVGHWNARPAHDAIRAFAPMVAADYVPPPAETRPDGSAWLIEQVLFVGPGGELVPVTI